MQSNNHIRTLLLSSLLCIATSLFANNIAVTAISLSNRNTSTQTVRVNFNLSWDNSWRTTSAPFNWDAAWVFVKYKVGTNGTWKHATLSTSGHTIPSVATSTQSDATGLFLYRSSSGSGTFSPSGIQLIWNYGTDGVANDAKIIVRVFAIEMVYNPPGGFQAGSGGQNTGELRTATDVSTSGTATTFTITGTSPTLQGNSSSSSPTNLGARTNYSTDLSGTATATLASGFPTGFDAFYSMKYEISQLQYVEFLNTLTYTQQAARTASAPNSAPGTGALSSSNANRNGIDIQVSGTATNFPAVYACNLNGNGIFNEADDGQRIACNFLNWDDLLAYLDWAALRPMTELEYEKSCRGNQTPVAGEYPWGSTSATALTGLTNSGLTNEIASNSSSNIVLNNAFSLGPVRTGIFSTASSNRSTSGAGYYGNMELGGNLWERAVTIGNSTGRSFSATNGNGQISNTGEADVSAWTGLLSGSGFKGGSWQNGSVNSTISDRLYAALADNTRYPDVGGRGIRSVSTGIVTDGLVLWLDAGITPSYPESGTTWTDLSGNRNDGTLSGPTYSSLDGGSLSYPNTTNVVTVPMSGIRPLTAITQESWVLITNNIAQVFIGAQYGSSVDNSYALWLNGANQWAAGVRISSGFNYQIFNSSVSLNVYYHFVHTYDGSTQKLYLNGTQVLSWSTSGSITYDNLNTQLAVGNDWNSGYNGGAFLAVRGRIAITRLYNRALTNSEVLQNFNAQKARFGL